MRPTLLLFAALGVLSSCSDQGAPSSAVAPAGPPRVVATHPPDGARGPFADLFTFGDGEDAPHFMVHFSRPVRISAFAPGMVTVAGFPDNVVVRAVALPGKEGEEQDVSTGVAFQLLIPNLLFPRWYEVGRTYEVLVDTSVRTADGLPLELQYRFSYLPEPELRISRFTPDGRPAEEAFPVTPAVQFNSVMNADAAARISIMPAVPGDWVNTSFGDMPSMFVFTGASDVRSGTTYALRVEAGLRDARGYLLTEGDSVSFRTAVFAVGSVEPSPGATGVSVETLITVPCGWPVDLASLDSGVTITPPVPGRWISESNPERFVLLPRDDLDEGVTYTLRIGTSVRAIDGTALASEFRWSFTTAEDRRAASRTFP